jgi:hypothetical protein
MKQDLLKDGFLPSEIYKLAYAKGGDSKSGKVVHQDFNFSSRPFQAMRRSRRRMVNTLRAEKWDELEIKTLISNWYRLRKHDIFSFLKLEYSPPKLLTDYQDAIRRKSRAQISRHFGRSYGRQLRKEIRPKHLPKRPLLPTKPRRVIRVRRRR